MLDTNKLEPQKMNNKTDQLTDELKEYRSGLIDTQRKLNESYDKLIIMLSGGSLALSITFLKDIIGSNQINHPILLLIAWGLFVLSLAAVLGEILFGIKAHKKAIIQVDNGTIHKQKVGGNSSYISTATHWLAAICLVSGLLFISAFAYCNLGDTNGTKETNTSTKAATKTEPTEKP
ncbi:MAG: hypothetical protein L3J88_05355 [Gammaproteobacteria bacterium]|nr:hypothetical protein [Gammaproteobacteria bacterium]